MMLSPGGWRDECVRTEFGSYVHELDITGVFAPMADTDFECEHGRLAGDPCPSPKITASQAWPNLGLRAGDVVQNWPHPHPCGCWPSELAERVPADAPEEILTGVVEPTPDLMSILTPRREPLMLTAAPERAALPAGPPVDDDAQAIANALASAAEIEPPKPKRRLTRVAHSTGVPLLDRIVRDIDAEIARLEAFRAILVESGA